MDFMHIITYLPLLLYLIFTHNTETTALPLTDLDTFISKPLDIDFPNYPARPVGPKTSLLYRLTRGYYYIENGEIIPVNPTYFNQKVPNGRRRQDSVDLYSSNEGNENGVELTPLEERYNKTHAKRKKLFVPNFFG